VLAQTTEDMLRTRLLAAQVEILLAAGNATAASNAATELGRFVAAIDTPALRADAEQARGSILLAGGDGQAALTALQSAYQLWRDLAAPYQTARVRVIMGRACGLLGDDEGAQMEWKAARKGVHSARCRT
jgi:hypothetical protein